MASKLLTRFVEGNAKFAATYTAPPPLMKMRDMWLKNGNKGAVIRMRNSSPHNPRPFMD